MQILQVATVTAADPICKLSYSLQRRIGVVLARKKKKIGVVLGGYMQLCENGLATASMVVQVGNRRPRISHAMSVHKKNAILIVQRVKVSNNLNF